MKKLWTLGFLFLTAGTAAGCTGQGLETETATEPAEENETENTVFLATPQENGLFSESAEFVIEYYSDGEEEEPIVLESLFFLPEGYCQFVSPVRSYWPAGRYYIEGNQIFVSLAEESSPYYFMIQEGGIVPLDSFEGFWRAGTYLEEKSGELSYSPETLRESFQQQPWKDWEMELDSVFPEMREYCRQESGQDAAEESFLFCPNGYCYYRMVGEEWREWPAGTYLLEDDDIVIQFAGDSLEEEGRTVIKLYGERLEAQTERENCWNRGTVWERNEKFSGDETPAGYLAWGTSVTGAELGNYRLWEEMQEEKEGEK